jgi:MarR family transcriptional regulator, organic hydroperoxide resistance regulator
VRRNELAKDNITPMHSIVLIAIQDIGNQATPSELAQWLFREPHSVSQILDRMEKEKLVRRMRDPKNKSRVRIVLTKKGKEIYEKTDKGESIFKIFSVLSKKEQELMISGLHKLLERALQELVKKYEILSPIN